MGPVWCALALLVLRVHAGPGETVVSLNTVRALRHTAEPFIGFSVSPQLLLTNHYSVSTLRMLKALSPAMLRVGDEDSDKLAFRTSNRTSDAVVFTEVQWASLNRFAAEAGLDLIFSIGSQSDWNHLFNASYRLGFGPSWQLGYKLSKNESSREVGEGLVRLRQTLDIFNLQGSAILGPDFQVCDTSDYDLQISQFFQEAGDYVNTATLQLDPLESKEDDKLSKLFASVERAMTRKAVKAGRFKNGLKKQIWIAEASGAEEGYTGEFTDAMRWALKLGVLAHAGAHSVLRRPTQLIAPTPDYWVSLLHRRLVGRTVLGRRPSSVAPRLRIFAHCAAEQLGAVTVWGVNYADDAADVSLRVGARVNEAVVHVLTRDTWEDAERGSTLLNGQLLHLSTGELPSLSGQQIPLGRNMSVKMPPQSVFFVVLPMRAPACLLPPARGPNYDPPRLPQAALTNARTSDKTSYVGNDAALTDVKNKGDFDLEQGGSYETTGKARQSRDNVKEDLEKSSKMILESLRAHVNGYDKQGEETQFGKLVDMTLTAINNGGSTDETDTRRDELLQITTEDSRDGKPTLELPLPLVPAESDGQVGREGTHTKLIEDFQSGHERIDDEDTAIKSVHNSDILSLSLIPPKDLSKDNAGDGTILTTSFNPGHTTFLSKNIPRNGTIEDSKIIRIKRSGNKESLVPNPPKGIDDSLLYRRIQFLRRNRNLANTTKVQESKQDNMSMNGTKLKPMIERSKERNHQNHHHSSGAKNQTNKVSGEENRTASGTPIALKNNDPATLHYHPGEFYETLGSLKVDKNVSLKDIEKADEEAIDLMIENSQHKKMGREVLDSHGNGQTVERKIDESTTENVEQYVKCDDEKAQRVTSGSRDKTENDNGKCSKSDQNTKTEHSSRSAKEVHKKTDEELKIEKPLESLLHTIVPLKADGAYHVKTNKTTSRLKRETGDISNITKFMFAEGENLTNSNHSAKPQFGMYVMDQTEGRKLFLEATVQEHNLDKRYNTELYNDATTEPTKVTITVRQRNKTVEEEERTPNFFLLNNLVIDKSDCLPLRKKVYSKELPEKCVSRNIQTALKDSKVEQFDDLSVGDLTSTTPKVDVEPAQNETAMENDTEINNNGIRKRILYEEDQPMSPSKIPSSEESNPNVGSLLRQLARKFADNFQSTTPTNTLNGANINHLENKISQNKQGYDKNVYLEENVKTSKNEEADTFTHNILGSVQDFSDEKMLSTNKRKNDSVLDKLTKNPPTEVSEVNRYPYKNTQSLLKGSGSTLCAKIAQGSSLPTINPALFDLTTESDKQRSLFQKSKMHPHSSSHARPLPIPTVKPQTHLSGPHLRESVQNSMIDKHEHTLIQGRPSTLEMLISKHKEKLNALKLRLQQAKERTSEAKIGKITHHFTNNPHFSVVKRSIFTVGGLNRIQGDKKIGFNFPGNKGLIKLLEDGVVKSSLPYETNSKHMTGQITNADMEDTSSEEFSFPQTTPNNLESTLKISPRFNTLLDKSQFSDNFQIEENLEIKKLNSGSANLWELRRGKPDRQDDILRHKRKPRAIHYPCMKDLFFNDYDTEDRPKPVPNNVNLDSKRSLGLPLGKNAQEKALPTGISIPPGDQLLFTGNNTQIKPFDLTSNEHSKKPKRSLDSVKRDEIQMLEILTNKIMTGELAKDISENSDQSENVLRSMLDKTISNVMSGKTGTFRMYELAKEYQRTNPDGFEILDSTEKNAGNDDDEKQLESLEEINKDMEIQEDSGDEPEKSVVPVTPEGVEGLNMHEETLSNPFGGTTTRENNESRLDFKETVNEIGNIVKSKLFIDSFMKKFNIILHDITSTVKHGLF